MNVGSFWHWYNVISDKGALYAGSFCGTHDGLT
ncbi:hypothetical protein D049_3780A, partial [Vibrio parahaemolyticus VPTS-2010]